METAVHTRSNEYELHDEGIGGPMQILTEHNERLQRSSSNETDRVHDTQPTNCKSPQPPMPRGALAHRPTR